MQKFEGRGNTLPPHNIVNVAFMRVVYKFPLGFREHKSHSIGRQSDENYTASGNRKKNYVFWEYFVALTY